MPTLPSYDPNNVREIPSKLKELLDLGQEIHDMLDGCVFHLDPASIYFSHEMFEAKLKDYNIV